MTDGVKLNISSVPMERLSCIEGIQLEGSFDRFTGEVFKYPITGRLGNFYIKITKCHKSLRGSLHINSNLRTKRVANNSDDFTYSEIQETIKYLSETLNIEPHNLLIENLEYGINIKFASTKQFFLSNTIVYNGFSPTRSVSYTHLTLPTKRIV